MRYRAYLLFYGWERKMQKAKHSLILVSENLALLSTFYVQSIDSIDSTAAVSTQNFCKLDCKVSSQAQRK